MAPRCTSTMTGTRRWPRSRDPFERIRDHVLLPWASRIAAVDAQSCRAGHSCTAAGRWSPPIPAAWLADRRRRSTSRRLSAVPDATARGARAFRRGGPACPRLRYDYAVIRVVPRVEREEFVNVGVILSCPSPISSRHGCMWIARAWQRSIPRLDMELVEQHLRVIPVVCRGGIEAGSIGALDHAAALSLAGGAPQHHHPDLGRAQRLLW